jgi:type I restriction-modification system DNA methylase subunit
MADAGLDLISMADIARLAGQSRATVGNWKARNPDFPAERARGSRGPLYDRAEMTAWLESTNRLDKRSPEVVAVWQLADQLRGGMTTEDAMPFILVLLAVMSTSDPADWRRLQESHPDQLDSLLRSTAQSLFPFADEVMPRAKLPAASVAGALATLSGTDRAKVALMADALLEQSARTIGHRGGEYLSPASVRKLVVGIAGPVGSVYNPASGIGQLMVDAATDESSAAIELVGQELNPRLWAMAQLNLAIHDVKADIALGDVFTEDRHPDLRADRVIAVPPWGQKLTIADRLMDDPRWVYGEPGPSDGNAAWIQHCIYHLADDGRAVVVLPNGALFEGGRARRIRQRIVKAGLLDAVLALPAGLFPWTPLACSLLVFAKGRPNADGKPAPTLMVDISDATQARGGRSTALSDELIHEVTLIYRDWVAGSEPRSENASVAHLHELAANDFVIDPGRYLSLPHTPPNLGETIRERSALLAQLDLLSQESRKADDHLKAILEERG